MQLVYLALLEAYICTYKKQPAASLGALISLLTELR